MGRLRLAFPANMAKPAPESQVYLRKTLAPAGRSSAPLPTEHRDTTWIAVVATRPPGVPTELTHGEKTTAGFPAYSNLRHTPEPGISLLRNDRGLLQMDLALVVFAAAISGTLEDRRRKKRSQSAQRRSQASTKNKRLSERRLYEANATRRWM
jgi:hypothetical protein